MNGFEGVELEYAALEGVDGGRSVCERDAWMSCSVLRGAVLVEVELPGCFGGVVMVSKVEVEFECKVVVGEQGGGLSSRLTGFQKESQPLAPSLSLSLLHHSHPPCNL